MKMATLTACFVGLLCLYGAIYLLAPFKNIGCFVVFATSQTSLTITKFLKIILKSIALNKCIMST